MAGNPFPNGLNLLKNKMRDHKSNTRRKRITGVCQEYGIVHEDQEWGQIRHSMITYLIDTEGYIKKFYVG